MSRALAPIALADDDAEGARCGWIHIVLCSRPLSFTPDISDQRKDVGLCWTRLSYGLLAYVDRTGVIHEVREATVFQMERRRLTLKSNP